MGMSDKESQLLRSIESVLGSENVTQSPPLNIDGLIPRFCASGCGGEVVRVSAHLLESERAAVIPAGSMSWLEGGNPVRRSRFGFEPHTNASDNRLQPAGPHCDRRSGTDASTLNELANLERQWLPLDPPGAA